MASSGVVSETDALLQACSVTCITITVPAAKLRSGTLLDITYLRLLGQDCSKRLCLLHIHECAAAGFMFSMEVSDSGVEVCRLRRQEARETRRLGACCPCVRTT